jgi:hypothetical protein
MRLPTTYPQAHRVTIIGPKAGRDALHTCEEGSAPLSLRTAPLKTGTAPLKSYQGSKVRSETAHSLYVSTKARCT